MTAVKSSHTSNDRRQRVQSAETGMSILKALARLGGSASLSAIASEVQENASKVHRYVVSLTQEGLVAQNLMTQHYYLGAESVRIGLAALRQCDPVRIGEASLISLRSTLQVTCFIAVMGNLGPTVLRIEEPSLPVTVNIRPGSVMPVLWSASGHAFLAFSDDVELQRSATAAFKAATSKQRSLLSGATSVAALCRQTREAGCAIVHDTLLAGISAISAPIFDARGRVVAVFTALGASNGFDTSLKGKICLRVIEEAANISLAMGFDDSVLT
jgi:DNA-binding IclR family transcriptional regulator